MNILLVNINLGTPTCCGGIESHSDTLASILFGRGHNVIVGCWKGGSIEIGAGKLVLPSRRITIRNSGDLTAIFRIIRVSLKERIDVVIANAGREYWPAAVAAKVAGAKVIFIRHQTDRLKKTTCMLINNYVDRIVAVSSAVRNVLIKSGVSGNKIDVIHNSIDPERFNFNKIDRNKTRNELGIYKGDIVVGTAGSLSRGKGIYELLSAVSLLAEKYPALKLLFVGKGPEMKDIKREAENLFMKGRVIFTGMRRDIARMYAAMDIFVLPSTCEEAFGMVLIEAMSMGKPVIGTAVGGIPDIIRNNVNGTLIPPGDAGAIAEAIARYLDDEELCKRIASEGRNSALRNFSDDAMGDKFERIIHAVGSKNIY